MVATLWHLSLLTITLIRASECMYVQPSLAKYRRLDNTPFGFQDVDIPDKRTKTSLSIVAPLDVLRQRLLLEIARRQMRENSIQAQKNREILRNIGKRSSGNEPNELERFEPYQQHVDLNAIINRIAAAAIQPNDRYNYFNMHMPDDTFDDDTNDMNILRMALPSRFHHHPMRTPFMRFIVDGDMQTDTSTNSDDNEQPWLKQSALRMKQPPQFMNEHHSLFRQLNQQLDEQKASDSNQHHIHHLQQQQQQQQQEQPQPQQQQQQKEPLKSFDSNGEFIQSLDLN